MFNGFEKLIEARIKKAQEQGAFENLPGSGKPLPWRMTDIFPKTCVWPTKF
jgi:hypothetical protein